MIRPLRVLLLRMRAGVLEAEIEHGEGLLADHKRRLANCYDELRKVRGREALLTPAGNLLQQAMRRAGK